jgi:ATP-dependent RNA helicase DeaD
LLGAARIEAQWNPAPSAAKVRKQLRKRFRQQIHERLATDDAIPQVQIDYAKGLLDGRDPAAVVALLLELAQPKTKREPMNIREPRNGGAPTVGVAAPGFVRFSINWGEKNGAAPNRLLGHVCRRGQVKSQLIGGIDIGVESSTFDVDASAAARFQKLVQRRDARDPHLRIVRTAAGAGPTGGPREPGRAKPFPKSKSKKRFGPTRKR